MPPSPAPATSLRPSPEASGAPRSSAPAAAPRVTVVVPTLNEEKTLGAVLRPLRAHAEALGLEVVVSDGGSTDGTLAIALALADRVVTHRGPRRQTIGEGRNAGAREASRGEASGEGRADGPPAPPAAPEAAPEAAPKRGAPEAVLLFFNADVALPADLAPLVGDLCAAARARGAATCRVLVDPARATLSERVVLGGANALYWVVNRLRIVGMGRGEVHAVRRDAFDAVGGYREHLAAGEDFDLFKRLMRLPGVRPVLLWRHVVHEDPRRYRQRGLWRTMATWAANAAWVAFRDRSRSTEWEAVR